MDRQSVIYSTIYFPHTPRAPRTPRRKGKEIAREMAESPVPILPTTPQGVRRKEPRIDAESLRAEMSAARAARSITPPRSNRSSKPLLPDPPESPTERTKERLMLRKKQDPSDILFIKRKPPVPESTSEVGPIRHGPRYVPQIDPYSRNSRRMSSITGEDELYYEEVRQPRVYPPGMDGSKCRVYPPEDCVILGTHPDIGCGVWWSDSVNQGPLNVYATAIIIAFQWKGYESLQPFLMRVHIPDYRKDPFNSRLKILEKVKSLFKSFREKVKLARESGEMGIPNIDVLAFGNNDVRVTGLKRRHENFYQVMFKYPTRLDRSVPHPVK